MIYAVHFPEAGGVLKIGCSGNRSPAVYVNAARQGARRRGWSIENSSRVWYEAGDLRTECYVQSVLAFEWPSAITVRQSRLAEWFRPGIPVDSIVVRLAAVYRKVPPDRLMPRSSITPRTCWISVRQCP